MTNIPGILYKKALRNLADGVFVAISAIITLRIIVSMTAWFESRTLKIILLIIYLLLLVIAVGYVFIARGAKKLDTIEEVSTDSRNTLLKKLLAR